MALQPKAENFAPELTARAQWLVWKDEAGDKKPYSAKTRRICDPTDPANWCTFEEAQAAHLLGDYDGFGFALANDGLVGVDLDGCVADGKPSAAASALLAHLRPAYVEFSPSGNGLRAFGYGEALQSGAGGIIDGLKAEFYSGLRYLTVTGHVVTAGPLQPLNDFKGTAERFRAARLSATNEEGAGERHASRIGCILAGDIYHDSLRDEAAALAAGGMTADAIEAVLHGLMDASSGPHDQRWEQRRREVERLARTAVEKFAIQGFADVVDGKEPDGKRYVPLTGHDLDAQPHLEYRVKPIFPKTGIAGIYGASGTAKSFLLLGLGAAIAEGAEWFGYRTKPAPVFIVALEGEAGQKNRVAAWQRANRRPLPDGVRMILQPFRINEPQDVADLAAVVPPGGVVFIDTLNRAAPEADENTSADMGRIIEGAKVLQSKIGGLVVLIHHTGKDQTRGARGHSSLFAAFDGAMEVSRNGDQREWKIAKSKDGRDGQAHCFQLDVINLGTDSDGDVITSCVVVQAAPLPAQGKPLTVAQQEAMTAFQAARVGTGGVRRDAWRAAYFSACPAGNDEAKRKAFSRAVASLVERGAVTERGDIYLFGDFEHVS
jgi:hypothetical protein